MNANSTSYPFNSCWTKNVFIAFLIFINQHDAVWHIGQWNCLNTVQLNCSVMSESNFFCLCIISLPFSKRFVTLCWPIWQGCPKEHKHFHCHNGCAQTPSLIRSVPTISDDSPHGANGRNPWPIIMKPPQWHTAHMSEPMNGKPKHGQMLCVNNPKSKCPLYNPW